MIVGLRLALTVTACGLVAGAADTLDQSPVKAPPGAAAAATTASGAPTGLVTSMARRPCCTAPA